MEELLEGRGGADRMGFRALGANTAALPSFACSPAEGCGELCCCHIP
ncbi:hypothetical protein SSAG_00694 [Streptomyces sp. Mg1]|nr:hypothetical protein SSAG_00694 [Streptomyces sp. Mg1]